VYLAVQRGQSPVLLKVTQAGDISVFDISKHKSSEIALPNLIKPGTVSTAGAKEDLRSLSITDIKCFKDEVFVSGISNAEFSSTLFKLSYPFKEGGVTVNSVQMYHSVHGMFETRAPIRAMTILPLNEELHVLAAYLCTPLVTIPLASLNGQHVKGKTIAELGFGNAPVTVLRFQSQDWHGNKVDNVLITHKNRGPQLFDVQTIEQENQKEGIERPTMMEIIIPKHTDVPLTGLTHVDDLDQQFLISLRRDIDTGSLDLVTFRKGAYFRLGDFLSEYVMPGFAYDESSVKSKGFQDMLFRDEGMDGVTAVKA